MYVCVWVVLVCVYICVCMYVCVYVLVYMNLVVCECITMISCLLIRRLKVGAHIRR